MTPRILARAARGERFITHCLHIAIKVKPIRPLSLFREYWGDPGATAARHKGDWYLTGDIGRTDQAGFFIHYVNELIHPHKRLREVELTARLPKTAEGKIRRGELRDQERRKAGMPLLKESASSVHASKL